ncbi:MAG: PAS domain S-box protein, partial [Bacteroidota bacterium]
MTHYLKEELYELIKKDERIFEFIQEGSLDGLWYWDLEKPENEWMNAKFWEVLGYNPNEMPHKSTVWQGIIHKEDLKQAVDNFNKHLENPDHPYDQIVRFKHKNKSIVWIRCRGIAIRDEKGKPLRMLGAHQDITALKQTEKQLQREKELASQREAKYRAMYENAPLAFQSLDSEGNIIDVNPQWQKILGYTREEVVGKWFGDFLHPDSKEAFRKRFPIFKKEGIVSNVEFKINPKNGAPIYVSFEGSAGLDEQGEFQQTYCTFKDITTEKEAENKIKESENLFKVIFEQSATGISQVSREGKFLQVNRRFCEIVGYTEEELLSMKHTQLTHPDDLHLEEKHFEKILKNEADNFTIEKRYIHKNKSHIWIRLFSNVVRKPDGEVDYAIGNIVDITHQKKVQKELLKSESRYKQLVETASDAIYLMDEEGYIIDTNQIATQILKKKKDEIIGSKINTVDPNYPPEAFIEFWKTVPFGEQRIFETTHITKHGKLIPIEISGKKFKIGKSIYYFGVARDITERKNA